MLVVSILLSLTLIGCVKNEQVIRPILDKDIFFVGERICMTKEYMQEVLEVKLDMKTEKDINKNE